MTELYQFMGNHWFLTLCSMFVLMGFSTLVANLVLKMWSKVFRTLMVLFRGWPPAHLDADGDFC